MLLPRSIALRGIEFSARVRALNGLWDAFIILIPIPRRFMAKRAMDDGIAAMPTLVTKAAIGPVIDDVYAPLEDSTALAPVQKQAVIMPVQDATVIAPTQNYEVRS